MGQILSFPVRHPPLPRRGAALRLVAVFILLLFTAAVIWTTVVSMGGTCLTSDAHNPWSGAGMGTIRCRGPAGGLTSPRRGDYHSRSESP